MIVPKKFLRQHKLNKFILFSKLFFVVCFFWVNDACAVGNAVNHKPMLTIKGLPQIIRISPSSYYIDKSRGLSFSQVRGKRFLTRPGGLSEAIQKYFQRANYWIKFSLENTDSVSAVAYVKAGVFKNIRIYEIMKGKVSIKNGGISIDKNNNTPRPELYTVKLILPPQTKINYFLFLSSTADYGIGFDQINIFCRKDLFASFYRDYYESKSFRILQILFLGFMFSQMLYVGFSRVIGIKRLEFLYYLIYLFLVTVYYFIKYFNVIGIYWPLRYYPQIEVYSKSILLALPYLFYIKFIRYILNTRELNKYIDDKLIRLEYFIGIYVFTDTALRFILTSAGVLNEILMITIFAAFFYGLILIIPLMRYKKLLINLVLAGSLAAGLGGVIGMMISLLQIDLGILHTNFNSLLSGQIGILVETIIFTTSLNIKIRMTEREKFETQEKLIAQLEENDVLKEKMEKTRNKIARDLHDDIGSTLSTILLYSNSAQAKVDFKKGEASEIFGKISNVAGNMMDEMSDIIWAINPMQDSMDKILKRMHYYAAPLANAQNMYFAFNVDEGIKQLHLSMDKRKNLFLIFKESVINAIKYSEGTAIYAELYTNDGHLHMLVKDDGKGFTDHDGSGNGLNNMKNRAEETGGRLQINSAENSGTTIHAIIPL